MLTESDSHMRHLLPVEEVRAFVAAVASEAWVGNAIWVPTMSAGAEAEAEVGPIPSRSAGKPTAGEAAAAATAAEPLPARWASRWAAAAAPSPVVAAAEVH